VGIGAVMNVRTLLPAIATVLLSAAPAAGAATKPTVSTGGASRITQTSATLTGKVNPNGARTTYFFQYGTSRIYGATTGPTDAGSGTHARTATADISGLAPNTRYHYRLVAQNSKGTTFGGDRTFTTKKQPLGFNLGANPNPATFGTGTTLAGQLTGTGNAGRTVKLQQKAFPYTAAFTDVGNPLVTDAAGNFSFPIPLLTVNTQFRVTTVGGTPHATSGIVLVGCAVRVSVKVSHRHVRRGHRVRFSGHVAPANDGALFAVQRLKKGVWVTVKGGSLHHSSSSRSRYAKTMRIRHFGRYRIFVGVNNQNTSGTSKTVRIRRRG
jgi:hypothetical protein